MCLFSMLFRNFLRNVHILNETKHLQKTVSKEIYPHCKNLNQKAALRSAEPVSKRSAQKPIGRQFPLAGAPCTRACPDGPPPLRKWCPLHKSAEFGVCAKLIRHIRFRNESYVPAMNVIIPVVNQGGNHYGISHNNAQSSNVERWHSIFRTPFRPQV